MFFYFAEMLLLSTLSLHIKYLSFEIIMSRFAFKALPLPSLYSSEICCLICVYLFINKIFVYSIKHRKIPKNYCFTMLPYNYSIKKE